METNYSIEELTGVEIGCECGFGIFVPLLSVDPPEKLKTQECPQCKKSLATGILAAELMRDFNYRAQAFVTENVNRKVGLRFTIANP